MEESKFKFRYIFRPIYVPAARLVLKLGVRHNSILYAGRMLRRCKDPDFRNYVLAYNQVGIVPQNIDYDDIGIVIHKCGDEHPDGILFNITLDTGGFGLCAQLVTMMNRCYFADRLGMQPVIDWAGTDLYKEDTMVNGTDNVFEYYYQPSAGISSALARRGRFVVFDKFNEEYGLRWIHIPLVVVAHQYTEKDIVEFGRIYKKYFNLREELKKRFQNDISLLLKGKKTLAVHARGCDAKLKFKNHPQVIPPEEYADVAAKKMLEIGAEQVFLATDDKEILALFQERFGDKLVYYNDVVRSIGNVMNCVVKENRPLHKYLLGVEILRDVYTLASCEGLVFGHSYVSFVARCIRCSFGKEYEAIELLDHGFNKEGRDCNDPQYIRENKKLIKIINNMQKNKEAEDETINHISNFLEDAYSKPLGK